MPRLPLRIPALLIACLFVSAALSGQSVDRPELNTIIRSAAPTDLAVSAKGWIYVVGLTSDPDFPTTENAFDRTCGTDGQCNPFQSRSAVVRAADNVLTVIDPEGVVQYATFLGGSGYESKVLIALAPDDTVWLAGLTPSSTFEHLSESPGCEGFGNKLWIGRFDRDLKDLRDFQCFLRDVTMGDIAVDAGGHLWIAGGTTSDQLPVRDAWQPRNGGQADMFVARFEAGQRTPLVATYIGGSRHDRATALAITPSGAIAVAGESQSDDFPLVRAAQSSLNSQFPFGDVAVLVIDASQKFLHFSSFWGGSQVDTPETITADTHGNIYVGGRTGSPDFPTTADAADRVCEASPMCVEGFITKFDAAGAVLASRFLGGSAPDSTTGLSVREDGRVIVGGWTQSADFPLVDPLPASATPLPFNGLAFLSVLDERLQQLLRSTFLTDETYRPASWQALVDANQTVYVTSQVAYGGGFAGTPSAYVRAIRLP